MANLIPLNGGGKKNEAVGGFKQAIADLQESLPEYIEYMSLRAQIKRAYFDDLVAKGFTEAQALELVAKDASI